VSTDGDPCTFVIMGGTSDLMRRTILPALSLLRARGALPRDLLIIGTGRRRYENHEYREWIRHSALEAHAGADDLEAWSERCVFYQSVGGGAPAYERLRDTIGTLESRHGRPPNRVLYLATPPSAFSSTIAHLGEAGLAASPGWSRLVVEKPFGYDLQSARELDELIHRYFDERQVYRIDHFPGKTTVQNLLVFRFANPIFESRWNRETVDNVQITVAEPGGVGRRGGYYDQTGALRDRVQNHLTHLLALVAMEAPVRFEADAIRDEKVKVLRSIRPLSPHDLVRGQYTGASVDGSEVVGYRDEPTVDPDSRTETFVALRLHIDTWRWQGVPFYLRTGKHLPRKLTRIVVTFREPPVCFFRPFEECGLQRNQLIIQLQPDEGFDLCFEVKDPDRPSSLRRQSLRFRYGETFGRLPAAYMTLVMDIVNGDQTLFVRTDEVARAWELYSPLVGAETDIHPYPAGTWGPPSAERLPEKDGRQWVTA
jgi:glucose-6-phosphate 1-dehydrogenase